MLVMNETNKPPPPATEEALTSALLNEPTPEGVARYERTVIASQTRAPDYYARARDNAEALGLALERYADLLAEQGRREGWLTGGGR